jgi:hypothetical protein
MNEGWEIDRHAGQDSLRSSRPRDKALKIGDVGICSWSNFPVQPRRRLLSVWWVGFVGGGISQVRALATVLLNATALEHNLYFPISVKLTGLYI